jgi:hypothetical protein
MLSMRESSDAIEGVCGCGLKVGSDRRCRDHNARWLLAQRYHDTEKNLKSTSATPSTPQCAEVPSRWTNGARISHPAGHFTQYKYSISQYMVLYLDNHIWTSTLHFRHIIGAFVLLMAWGQQT